MSRIHACIVGATLLVVAWAPAARADDGPEGGVSRADANRPVAPHTDSEFVPIVGGDSDIGIGAGFVGGAARYQQGYWPYRWRIESAAFASLKRESGTFKVPYQDYYTLVTLTGVAGKGSRLELRPSFDWASTLRYYGLGNASSDAGAGDHPELYEFSRKNATMKATLRVHAGAHVYLEGNLSYTHNWIDVPVGTKLATDLASNDATVRRILGGTGNYGVSLLEYAILYDTRDHESAPGRGVYHQLRLKISPGAAGDAWLPYRYMQGNAVARFYEPIYRRYLVLALRAMLDVQVGDPPLYELARYDDTSALGGPNGVRGVPSQRYAGKVKALANVELRSELVPIRLFGSKHMFGIVGFADAGRLWTELAPHPELDGTGVGLKWGVGGGLRLTRADTLTLRFDVAYSPDARPIGIYFGAGQMF